MLFEPPHGTDQEDSGAPQNTVATFLAVSLLLVNAQRTIFKDTGAALRYIKEAAALIQSPSTVDGVPMKDGLSQLQIQQIKNHIEGNLEYRITVADLADIAKLSSGYFSHAFKASFGNSPHAYILSRRLQRAAELMLASPMPLCAIAMECGFSDQAHFCRRFREVAGLSPNLWRSLCSPSFNSALQ